METEKTFPERLEEHRKKVCQLFSIVEKEGVKSIEYKRRKKEVNSEYRAIIKEFKESKLQAGDRVDPPTKAAIDQSPANFQDMLSKIFNDESEPLTSEQFISHKLALHRIELSLTQEIIPALNKKDTEALAALPQLTQDKLKKDIETINGLTDNDNAKDQGSDIISYLPAFASACQLSDFDTAFIFGNMLLSYFKSAKHSLNRRVKFQIQ